jgi:two-component system sensor histidine kinase TctE
MVVGSLTVVAILLGAGGAWLINGIVEHTADRLLGASARAIAETLAVEQGEITLDLPPSALGMLENAQRDNVYYSVRRDADLVTGYPDLPSAPPAKTVIGASSFRYDTYRGERVRVASEARSLPRIPGVIVVQVAETLQGRHDLARQMLGGLAAVEAAFVLVAGLLVWPAVRWSLRPVIRLREQMDARPAGRPDFAPLPTGKVPVELAGVVAGFNAMLQRLELGVEGMRRFTADASHQMRTPLAILRTHLGVLKRHEPATDEGKASVADIELATDRLQNLLTGLITLARAEDPGPGVRSEGAESVDLGTVVHQVLDEHQATADARGVKLRVGADEEVSVSVDTLLVRELVSNLIDNGVRYNRPGGFVEVRLRRSAGWAVIEVEDDGPGVPAADRQRIFQRFYRLSRDSQQFGSGLGLSIVQAIAGRLGARLSVSDGRAQQGLKISISLPASPNPVGAAPA